MVFKKDELVEVEITETAKVLVQSKANGNLFVEVHGIIYSVPLEKVKKISSDKEREAE